MEKHDAELWAPSPDVLISIAEAPQPAPGRGAPWASEARLLLIIEDEADLAPLDALAGACASVVCLGAPQVLDRARKRLVGLCGAVQLLPLTDQAVGSDSVSDLAAARWSERVTTATEAVFTELFRHGEQSAALVSQARALAVSLESTVYTRFCLPVVVCEAFITSGDFDAVVVLRSTADDVLSFGRVVLALRPEIPAWLLCARGVADVAVRQMRAWGKPVSAPPALDRHSVAVGLKGLTDQLSAEERAFAGEIDFRGRKFSRCGLFISQAPTKAMTVGAAQLAAALSELAPLVTLTFDATEAAVDAWPADLAAAGCDPARVLALDVPLPGRQFKNAVLFLFNYLAGQLGRTSLFRVGDKDLVGDAVRVIRSRIDSIFGAHLMAVARSRALMQEFCPEFVFAYPGVDIMTRNLVGVAREIGVPTFDVQSIFIADSPRNRAHWAGTADHIMAMDARFARTLVEDIGWSPERVATTGSPRLDLFVTEKQSLERDEARMAFPQLRRDAKVVTFFTQIGRPADDIACIGALRTAALAAGGVQVVAKLHPRMSAVEKAAFFAAVPSDASGGCLLLQEGDAYDLIRASDIVGTRYSNVALEAACLDRPVMVFNLTRETRLKPLDLETWGIGAPIYSPDDAARYVASVVRGGEQAQAAAANQAAFFEENPQYRDGGAVARIVAEVARRVAGADTSSSSGMRA